MVFAVETLGLKKDDMKAEEDLIIFKNLKAVYST